MPLDEIVGTENGEEYTIMQIGPTVSRKDFVKTPEIRDEVIDEYKSKNINNQSDSQSRPLTIRQRHKAAKIKKKYKNQDDEERELRMMILGTTKGQEKSKHLMRIFLFLRALTITGWTRCAGLSH